MRIEHVQFLHEADGPRFVRRGDGSRRRSPIVASPQPCHLLTDIEGLRRLTPDRLERAFAVRELIEHARDAGVDPAESVVFGSDTPVAPPEPGDNVQAAVHRRRPGMAAGEAVGMSQAISESEALGLMRPSAGVLG
jgi:predicted amidohydrolase YtcJ